jgi:nicotinate phosphoribosyltransferase
MGIALLTDLYELTMVQAYLRSGMMGRAVFEFFCRRLPPCRSFLLAVGLEEVLRFFEGFRFQEEDIRWLEATGRFSSETLGYLETFSFSGDVYAMPEGTPFFAHEPVLRLVAPLPEGQLVESRLMNLLHYQVLVASKAIRCRLAAGSRRLVEFGLRRAHGAEAALLAARASYVAGFDATSNVLAAQLYGIPISGTMAHSFVLAHDSEEQAFLEFAKANPKDVVFLLDTYDTEQAAHTVARLAPSLLKEGIWVRGVRLDSGDLLEHARRVRQILDRADLPEASIFVSGNLDEYRIAELVRGGAPIDGFGVGTAMDTSSDAPYLDCAYKLQAYQGKPKRKHSEGKATWPGTKQVYRFRDRHGGIQRDKIALEGEIVEGGQPLLRLVMKEGKRVEPPLSLEEIRRYTFKEVEALPAELKEVCSTAAASYPVEISPALARLQEIL